MPSDELKKLSIENAPKRTKTSAGLETVDETVARAKAMTATKPPVITPETLSPQPTPTLTPPATPTEAPALQADLAVQAEDAFTKQQEQKAQTAETAKTSALDEYLAAIRATQGETDLTSQLYGQEGGVDDITLELNDINDQIRKEQRALELAKRDVTERGGGLASGAAAEIGNLERVSLQKQADLSIIQMGIQGRYDSAKAIADRAVAAQLEKQKILNEALKVNYEDKKSEWTTAEQREFETLLGNRERAYQERQQQLTDIKDFALSALQAGAPVSSVQRAMGAKSLDEAMSLVGSYLRPQPKAVGYGEPKNFGTADNPIWKRLNPTTGVYEDVPGVVDVDGTKVVKVTPQEIQNLNETEIATNSLNKLVDDMITSIEEKGTQVLFGEEAGKRGSARTNLLLAMKNLEKTGALDAGTINVLSETIPTNTFRATEAAQIAALENLKETVNGKTTELINSYRGTTAELDPRTSRIFKQQYQPLPEEDQLEVQQMLGNSNTTTATTFNPSSYY